MKLAEFVDMETETLSKSYCISSIEKCYEQSCISIFKLMSVIFVRWIVLKYWYFGVLFSALG